MFPGKWYDEIRVGERFGTRVTVTETHLVLGSGLFGDFNPLHVDEEFSRQSIFGGRILHGPFTSALVAAPVGMYFSGTAIAYLRARVPLQESGAARRYALHRMDRDRAGRRGRRQDPGQRAPVALSLRIQRRSIAFFHHH